MGPEQRSPGGRQGKFMAMPAACTSDRYSMHRLGNVAATELRGPVWAWRRWFWSPRRSSGGLVSARLERADLRVPIVFVAVGAILATRWAWSTPRRLRQICKRPRSGGLCVGKRALDAFSISTQITAAWPLLGFLIKGVWMLWLTGPASHGPGKGDTAAPTRASRT